jgi:RHS repeat-associated protein
MSRHGEQRHASVAGKARTSNRSFALKSGIALTLLGAALGVQAASVTRTSAFDYNGTTGQLAKEIIEPGSSTLCLVTTYDHDAFGNKRATTTRNCNGSVGSQGANNSEAAAPAAGDLATFTARGASTTYSADGRFPLTSTVGLNGSGGVTSLSQTETRVFDSTLGVMTQLTGPNQLSTQWKYDAWGRKILEKRADGTGTKWEYQYCTGMYSGGGTTISCPTIAGAVGAYAITATPVAAPIDIATGSAGLQNGPYSRTYYDTLGRAIRSETQGFDGSGVRLVYQDSEYNNLGQVVRSSEPYFAGDAPVWVVTRYDWLGRAKVVTQPDGGESESTYAGLTITVTQRGPDITPRSTTQTRNVADQLVTVTDPLGKTLTSNYDPHGNLLNTTDHLGNITRVYYDARGRKEQMVDPDMGTWTYRYNALGELKEQTDAKYQVTRMDYDILGRLTAKTEPSLNTYWYYDRYADGSACNKGIGKLCEARAGNGYVRRHVYDNLGRASQTTTTVGGSNYTGSVTYDLHGRVDTTTYPGSALTIRPQPANNAQANALGFKQGVINAGTGFVYWTVGSINARGQIVTQTYGNTVATTHTFDPLSGRLRQTVAGAGNGVQNIAYTYDTIGNLKTRNDALTGVNATYGYDNLNRLDNETRQGGGLPSAQAIHWTYDEIGNIKTRSDVGTYTYNPSGANSVRPHAVTGVSGTVNGQASPGYQYDANGNLHTVTTGGATLRSVTWNSFNKVDSVTQTVGGTSNRLDFLYDSEGQRVREVHLRNGATQRTSVYLGSYEEETIGGVTKKKHYIGTPAGTVAVATLTGSTWSTQYWHKDHLGSPMVITNESAAVVERLAYEPFGKRRNANGVTDANGTLTATSTRRGFTGHEHDDEVGLINMNGRVYDQAIGRFLSADPTLQAPTYMQSYNRYAYMWNSPLNGTDPSGYTNIFAKYDREKNRLVAQYIGVHVPGSRSWAYERLTGKHGYQIKSAALSYGSSYCGWWAWACNGAAQAGLARAYGASEKDALKQGAIAAAASYLGAELDANVPVSGASSSAGTIAGNIAGHAAIGCAAASAGGGDCRKGALAGGFSASWSAFGPGLSGNVLLDFAQQTLVGGITSRLGGGSFANGALSGAFSYAFGSGGGGDEGGESVDEGAEQVPRNTGSDDDVVVATADDGPESAGHTKNKRESNREKHEKGDQRRGMDRGGEKGDDRRAQPRTRPPGYKGKWPRIVPFISCPACDVPGVLPDYSDYQPFIALLSEPIAAIGNVNVDRRTKVVFDGFADSQKSEPRQGYRFEVIEEGSSVRQSRSKLRAGNVVFVR